MTLSSSYPASGEGGRHIHRAVGVSVCVSLLPGQCVVEVDGPGGHLLSGLVAPVGFDELDRATDVAELSLERVDQVVQLRVVGVTDGGGRQPGRRERHQLVLSTADGHCQRVDVLPRLRAHEANPS